MFTRQDFSHVGVWSDDLPSMKLQCQVFLRALDPFYLCPVHTFGLKSNNNILVNVKLHVELVHINWIDSHVCS